MTTSDYRNSPTSLAAAETDAIPDANEPEQPVSEIESAKTEVPIEPEPEPISARVMSSSFFPFDADSIEPLHRAFAGDYRKLAERIRAGTASQKERDYAAALIERAPRPHANRPAAYETFQRNLAIYHFIQERLTEGYLKDAAVAAAEAEFGLKKSTIYEIVQRMEAAHAAAHSDN
jgi:hypothetical protein